VSHGHFVKDLEAAPLPSGQAPSVEDDIATLHKAIVEGSYRMDQANDDRHCSRN